VGQAYFHEQERHESPCQRRFEILMERAVLKRLERVLEEAGEALRILSKYWLSL